MALTFADTHNMITYLTKSDASEGFEQIINFLNASAIQYALTVNPNIYVSCIKQFWSFVSVKKVNDVMRLQALIDRKKVIITEDTVREALHLDDVKSIDCLPNEENFTELARMGTAWNEFSSSMASAIICLATVVVGVDIDNVVAEDVAEPNLPSPTPQPPQDLPFTSQVVHQLLNHYYLHNNHNLQLVESSIDTVMDDQEDASKHRGIIADLDADKDVTLEEVDKDDEIAKENADAQRRQTESQAYAYHIELEHANKVLSMQDDEPEPAELKEVVKVVTTAKLMTEVVIAADATITLAFTITVAPSAARRRTGVVIRDPEETATLSTIVYSELKSRDKGKGIMRKPQTEARARKNMIVYLKNMAGFKMEFFKGMSYDDIRLIFEKYFNSNVAFLEKTKEQLEEEESKALKRKTKSSEEKAVKKQKLDEEVEELKKHLQIMPNDDDDVYTKATPLALKIPVVDYEIHTANNKPYYKIIQVNGTHQLFLSFLSLLRNFNREDLEVPWQIVKEIFASLKPKNFSDDFLLTTLKPMFEKPDIEAQMWKNQRGVYGLAKAKSRRLLNSCGVHIITFTTTQMILLVERRYPLRRFTLDQMLNNVRLEVKEESEVSLELLSFGVDAVEDFKEYMLRDYYCWLKTYCCWCKLMLLDDAADIKLRLLEQSAIVGIR
nr:hypothetical protein [Tanacetum cinerariifolium]